MNNLSKYISDRGMTRGEFAKRVGISAPYLSEILSGPKRPSIDLAFKIESETGGEVPASCWVRHEIPSASAPAKEAG